jgi:OPT family oligopeptide transporter
VEIFMKERIPTWVAITGYISLAVISIIVIPHIFTPVKWYYVLITYIIAPVLAFCNAYGMGLTDWSLASTYGKLALFIFGAWAGTHGGVLAGLALCGVMMPIAATAADLMQDFKTGYLTLSSPRSMFVSQLLGCLMGCVLAPLTFWLFWTAFPIGDPTGIYKAPYAIVYRSMALIGVEGFSALPAHCLQICYGMFAAAVLISLLRDYLPRRLAQFIPIPMAMAIPFYIGGYFAIDMFVGTLIRFGYERLNRAKSDMMSPAIAAGLICGDGVWTVPSAILALSKVNPPLCMYFYTANAANALQG